MIFVSSHEKDRPYSCASLSWHCPTNQGQKIKASHPYLLLTSVRSDGRIRVESSASNSAIRLVLLR